ncbi:DUF1129 family protein [Marinilactibacillus sp. Marseille-P9653]|uniref:DUF1129 family protein n=1 Tax=Marinilactibacillus sp. Marseille-P9653 TaxID=2866583 RepID=UPI001CE3B781|nr:DUF1129 family protein [Marinilactibacillus sp. Marseille-P9653]
MNDTKLVIQQNNELREELTEENKAYYEEMLVYMRVRSWLKDEEKVEEILMQVLQDLISAQGEGVTAEAYFGKDPRSHANQILTNLERNWVDHLQLGSWIVGFTLVLNILNNIITMATRLNLVTVLSRSFLIYVAVFAVFKWIEMDSFTKTSSKWKDGLFMVIILSIFALGMIAETMLPYQLLLNVPLTVSWGILIICLIGTIWKFFMLPREERKAWVLPLLFLVASSIIGLIKFL